MKMHELLAAKSSVIHQVPPETLVHDCISLMNEQHIGAVMVVDSKGEMAGILTERDLLRGYHCCDNQPGVCKLPVKELMTPADRLVTITSQCPIDRAMNQMTANKVRHLPILDPDNGSLIGVVSIGDLIKALLGCAEKENQTMKQYMFGQDQIFPTDHIPMV